MHRMGYCYTILGLLLKDFARHANSQRRGLVCACPAAGRAGCMHPPGPRWDWSPPVTVPSLGRRNWSSGLGLSGESQTGVNARFRPGADGSPGNASAYAGEHRAVGRWGSRGVRVALSAGQDDGQLVCNVPGLSVVSQIPFTPARDLIISTAIGTAARHCSWLASAGGEPIRREIECFSEYSDPSIRTIASGESNRN